MFKISIADPSITSNNRHHLLMNGFRARGGFSLLEILIIIVVIGIIAGSILSLQTSSWKRTNTSNRLLIAGQMIEKQVESLRMRIDQNPATNFPPTDSSIKENGINLSWHISTAYRPSVNPPVSLPNVRKCDMTAVWGKGKGDTLIVSTYLAKSF